MSILQETARMQFEARKSARRQQAVARNQELIGALSPSSRVKHLLIDLLDGTRGLNRIRSSSGGSKAESIDANSLFATSSSQPAFSVNSSTSRLPPYSSPSLSHSSSFTAVSPLPSNQSGSVTSLGIQSINAASVLSPIANRVRERDADAIEAYKKRNRSGSAGTQTSDSRSTTNGISTLPTINSSSHLPIVSDTISTPPLSLASRRLRSSVSAAQLRSPPPTSISTAVDLDLQAPRNRSGTTPTSSRPLVGSPLESSFTNIGGRIERQTSSRRAATILPRRPSEGGDFTGPSRDYAIFPEPPSSRQNTDPAPAQTSTAKARRAAFALLSKPLPSIDGQRSQREHRRGISASDMRT